MSDVLFIRLQGTPDAYSAEWMTFDTGGARVSDIVRGSLEQLATVSNAHIAVMIPGTDVLLAAPVLPARSAGKLAQLVPYALEEQLASDVEDVHFAIGRREPQRPGIPVAAIAHAQLQAWLAVLQAAGIHCNAMYPETAGLPITANGVTVLIDGNRVYVRREEKTGAVIDVEPLIEGLQLALDSGAQSREHVTLYVTESDYERERDLLEGLREFTASLQLKLLPDGALPLLASTLLRTPAINLLQGKYTIASPVKASLAPWRYAAGLLGAFLLIHLATKAVEFNQLTRAEGEIDTAVQQVFQSAMPGAPQPDPDQARRQMQARLSAIRGANITGGLMGALDTLSLAFQQVPGTQLEALSYRANTTDLRLLAPDVNALDRIQQVVASQGASAEIQSATPRDSRVEGRLQLRAGA